MDSHEQKNKTQKSKFFTGHQSDAGNVLFTAGLRLFVQDALRRYGELLGYRYHILLSLRLLLAAVLSVFQIL